MPAKDGLIIFRKRFSLTNVKITWEAASADGEATDNFPKAIKKMRRKGIFLNRNNLSERVSCLNRFLMQTKVPILGGKKKPQRTFTSKEEKQVLGFKVGRNRLTLSLCANTLRFMIRTALNNKAANLWVLKRKDQNQLPVLIVPQEGLDNGTPFLDWSVRKYLAS